MPYKSDCKTIRRLSQCRGADPWLFLSGSTGLEHLYDRCVLVVNSLTQFNPTYFSCNTNFLSERSALFFAASPRTMANLLNFVLPCIEKL